MQTYAVRLTGGAIAAAKAHCLLAMHHSPTDSIHTSTRVLAGARTSQMRRPCHGQKCSDEQTTTAPASIAAHRRMPTLTAACDAFITPRPFPELFMMLPQNPP